MSDLEVKPQREIKRRQQHPLTPKRQEQILEQLRDFDRQVTLSTVARKAGIPPKVFIAAIHRAAENPKDKFHYFSRDVFEAWAEREERILQKAYDAAEKMNKWEAFITMLERMYREDWVKPSEHRDNQPNVQIGFVEKMAIVSAQNTGQNALPTAD